MPERGIGSALVSFYESEDPLHSSASIRIVWLSKLPSEDVPKPKAGGPQPCPTGKALRTDLIRDEAERLRYQLKTHRGVLGVGFLCIHPVSDIESRGFVDTVPNFIIVLPYGTLRRKRARNPLTTKPFTVVGPFSICYPGLFFRIRG